MEEAQVVRFTHIFSQGEEKENVTVFQVQVCKPQEIPAQSCGVALITLEYRTELACSLMLEPSKRITINSTQRQSQKSLIMKKLRFPSNRGAKS